MPNPSRIKNLASTIAVAAICLASAFFGYLIGRHQATPSVRPVAPPSVNAIVPAPDIDTARAIVRRRALDGLKPLNYGDLWKALAVTDADPDRPEFVELIYSDESRSADAHGGNKGQWNREHLWPRFRGGVTLSAGPGTDLHLVRPCDVQTNSRRGNKWFDDGGEPVRDATARADGDSWEPPAEERGDIARSLAYGAVAYDERPDLRLVAGEPDNARDGSLGNLEALRAWHHADPVDDRERARDRAVRELQGNGNPFVTHPELFDLVWPR